MEEKSELTPLLLDKEEETEVASAEEVAAEATEEEEEASVEEEASIQTPLTEPKNLELLSQTPTLL